MTREIDIDATAEPLAKIFDQLEDGERVSLLRRGRPVGTLTATGNQQKVRLGLARGKFHVPEDFDAPLPDDVLALFYDSPVFPEHTATKLEP